MEQLSLIPINTETVKPADHWVTKANELVEANYRLSLVQQKIVITMASLIQPQDEDFKWYRLHIRDFMKIFGTNNHNIYREMVGSVHNLMERVVTIYLGNEAEEYLKTHWVQNSKYKIGGGYVDVSFEPRLKPFFLHLKERFTTYKLENVMQLKSAYSIRIYELLKQYQGIGKRLILIEKLRGMLGIEPKEYRLYGDFKRYVLSVAQKEINEKTDISFTYKEIKQIRKVHELEFMIDQKPQPAEVEKPGVGAQAPKKSNASQRRAELKEERHQQKIQAYIDGLSPEDLAELTKEAEALARKEGGIILRDREIREPMLTAYRNRIVKMRIG